MKPRISAAESGSPVSQNDSSSSSRSELSSLDDDRFTQTPPFSTPSHSCGCTAVKSPSFRYTSLRDIFPASPPPPPPPPSPPPGNRGAEILIRNRLVKQAARAYLQPMASRPELVSQGLFGKFKGICCGGECGCLAWLDGVVSDVFGKRRTDDDGMMV